MAEAASYLTLEPGTEVQDRLCARVGTVKRVLRHGDGHFDGLLVTTPAGVRFVDAHEVRNVSASLVELAVTRSEVEHGDPSPPYARRVRRRLLARMLGRDDRVPRARWGKTVASDSDREAALGAIKRAYIEDRITDDELGDLVGRAHEATTVGQLDLLLREAGW